MSFPTCQNRSSGHCSRRAYFSFDAAFAVVLAVLAFSYMALLSSSHSKRAIVESVDAAKERLALRLSSHILAQSSLQGGLADSSYMSVNELDFSRVQSLPLGELAPADISYLSLRLRQDAKDAFFSSWGSPSSQVFCVQRLAKLEGELAVLEVCIS